jgi:hypothetical protein
MMSMAAIPRGRCTRFERSHRRVQHEAEHEGEHDGQDDFGCEITAASIPRRNRPPKNTVLISDGIGKSSSSVAGTATGTAAEVLSAALRLASNLSLSIAAIERPHEADYGRALEPKRTRRETGYAKR